MRIFGEDSGDYGGLLAPQKTIKPVTQPTAGKLTLDELLKRNLVGQQVFDPLSQQLGLDGWQFDGGTNEAGQMVGSGVADPTKLQALQGYSFDWKDTGPANTGTLTAYDPTGAKVGDYGQTDQTTGSALAEWAALAAAGFGGAGLAGFGPLGGALGGLGAASTATPISAAEQISFMAANGMTDAAIAAAAPELAAAGGLTGVGGYAAAAPAVFNAAADSQLASSQLGITGAQSAATATAPAAVDLGSLGGITSTAAPMPLEALRASELAGYSTNGTLPSSAAVPTTSGGLLSGLPSGIKDATTGTLQWLKDNPTLGRLLLGGATSLLSQSGSGSSGSTAPAKTGPAVQWTSPMQQGLLSPVQQYAPPAIQQNQPAGLLAQGYANDGAWRYLKG